MEAAIYDRFRRYSPRRYAVNASSKENRRSNTFTDTKIQEIKLSTEGQRFVVDKIYGNADNIKLA